MNKRVAFIAGARPELINMAPVTGQHRQMLTQTFDVFGLVPEFDLAHLDVLVHALSIAVTCGRPATCRPVGLYHPCASHAVLRVLKATTLLEADADGLAESQPTEIAVWLAKALSGW